MTSGPGVAVQYSVQAPDGQTYGTWGTRGGAIYFRDYGHPRNGEDSMSAPYEPKPPAGSILVERTVTYGDWVPERGRASTDD